MRRRLLDFLACISCNSSNMLIQEAMSGNGKEIMDDISDGYVICSECGKKYPIVAGIPIMLDGASPERINEDIFRPSIEHETYSLQPTKKVHRLLSNHEVDTALDVACGLGAYTPYFRCNTLVSFDISAYFIKKCLERAGKEKNKHWLVADMINIPLADHSFDLIFASSILEHLTREEAELSIRKLANLLKEQGILQIDVPNSAKLQELIRRILTHVGFYKSDEFEEHPELGHHSLFLKRDLEGLGFEVHGCIGWVTRRKLPLGILWELYDMISWYLPSVSGTLIGLRGDAKIEVSKHD